MDLAFAGASIRKNSGSLIERLGRWHGYNRAPPKFRFIPLTYSNAPLFGVETIPNKGAKLLDD